MFDLEATTAYPKLENAIDNLLDQLLTADCGSETYTVMVDQLNKLYKAREIHSKIKVTEFEAVTKAEESDIKLKLAEIESNNKKAEVEANHALKQREIDGNHKLKDLELGLQKIKHDSEAELRAAETEAKLEETKDRRRVKPDTLALVAANIAGIVLVIGHERASVIATKALGFVTKALK